jgi:hypothetical protein
MNCAPSHKPDKHRHIAPIHCVAFPAFPLSDSGKLSKDQIQQLPSNYRGLYISPNNQFITRVQQRGNSVQ